jgi:peptidyl-prolyl cis-trans isomerase D
MLQNIRDNIQGVMAKIIIGIIIVPFALFGVDSLMGGGGTDSVAEVNGEPISASALQQAVNQQRRNILQNMEGAPDPALLDEAKIQSAAINQLIEQQLTTQAANDAGLDISEAAVDQIIVSLPQFQQDGQFSPQLYQNILRSNGYTLAYFKQLVKQDVILRQLNGGLAATEFVTPQQLSDAAKLVAQQRSFSYLTIPLSQFADQINLSQAQLAEFYQQNSAQFMAPEQVKLNYIELRLEDFAADVDEQSIRDAYEMELANMTEATTRRVAHVLIEVTDQRDEIAALALAQEIISKAKSGVAFSELAREFSDDLGSANDGGDLGFTSGDTFPKEFESALSKLEQGEISAPVITDAGIHVLQATEVKKESLPTLEERRSHIERSLALQGAESKFVTVVEELKDLVFNSEGLASPALELGLDVRSTDWLSRDMFTGSLADPRVVSAVFSESVLQNGNNSEVIELASDHYLVVSIAEHQPATVKPLDAVKKQVIEQLTAKLAAEQAGAKAIQLIADAKSAGSLAEVSNEAITEQDVTRSSSGAVSELTAEVFAMPFTAGEVSYKAVNLANGDVAVVALADVKTGSLDALTAAEKEALQFQLGRINLALSLASYQQSVRQQADIKLLN